MTHRLNYQILVKYSTELKKNSHIKATGMNFPFIPQIIVVQMFVYEGRFEKIYWQPIALYGIMNQIYVDHVTK
jgi:hypothetical protein